jgi:hypothetical protein
MECANCKTTSASIYKEVDSRTLCSGCADAETNRKIAAANAPSAAQVAIWDAERKLLEEQHKREGERARDPYFCRVNDHHRDSSYQAGRPAVGFDERGQLCCAECLPPELNPAKLAERIAVLEQAMAAKSSRKAAS